MSKFKVQINVKCQNPNAKFGIGIWNFICHLKFGFWAYHDWSDNHTEGNYRKGGFTIMEVIVAVGIMAMLSLLYVANFKGFQHGLAVESDADRLAGAIRQAQLWALTGELVGGSRPDGGYGLYLPAPCTTGTCTFTMFANTCAPTSYVYDNGCDTVMRSENFDTNVSVSSTTPAGNLTIIFVPPTAKVYRNTTEDGDATINLSHRQQSGKTKTVALDGVSGQINVQ